MPKEPRQGWRQGIARAKAIGPYYGLILASLAVFAVGLLLFLDNYSENELPANAGVGLMLVGTAGYLLLRHRHGKQSR